MNRLEEYQKFHADRHALEQRERDQESRVVEARLEKLNELRSDVITDRAQYMRVDIFDERHKVLENKVEELEKWRFRAAGMLLVLLPLAGVIGAAIMRAFT